MEQRKEMINKHRQIRGQGLKIKRRRVGRHGKVQNKRKMQDMMKGKG